MLVLLLATLRAQAEPSVGEVPKISAIAALRARSVRLQLGTQLGFPQIFGLFALGTFSYRERPRLDVDVMWEPSKMSQNGRMISVTCRRHLRKGPPVDRDLVLCFYP